MFKQMWLHIYKVVSHHMGLPWWHVGKEPACQCKRPGFDPCVGKIPLEKETPTPVFLPGKSHGQRSLVGYGPWSRKRTRHDLATKEQPYS